MTSLKTSIKTITYLSDIGCLEIQGASLNMILTGIDYEYKTESALQFDLQFEQIRLVSYATTNAIAVKTASPKSTGGQVKSRVPTNAGTASTTKDTLPTYDGEVK
nr:hypothetical protein [Escherichia coli]